MTTKGATSTASVNISARHTEHEGVNGFSMDTDQTGKAMKRRPRRGYRKKFLRPPKGHRPYWRRKQQHQARVPKQKEFRGFDIPPLLTPMSVQLVDCVLHPTVLKDSCERGPIRVLSLFDGIGTGLHTLRQLGLEIGAYFSCEVDVKANALLQSKYYGEIVMLGDVLKLTAEKLQSLGRIDLLIGGSPCSDLSLVNPARRGLHGEGSTGSLFFEFVRIRDFLISASLAERHSFYWLLENTFSMEKAVEKEMSKCLGTLPVVRCSSRFTAMTRKRNFWGNIPGLPHEEWRKTDSPARPLQSYLKPYRQATVNIMPTITSSTNSQCSGKASKYPVIEDGEMKLLHITEMESLFGFPEHYTDGPNLTLSDRRKLLGRAWCVNVMMNILAPLKALFKVVKSEN